MSGLNGVQASHDPERAIIDGKERAIVGGLLYRPGRDTLALVADVLAPDGSDYRDPVLGALHAACVALGQEGGAPWDLLTVAERVPSGHLVARGGVAFLAELAEGVATVEPLRRHAEDVRRAALRGRQDRIAAEIPRASEDRRRELVRELADLDRAIEQVGRAAAAAVLPTVRIGDVADPGPPKWLVRDVWTAGAFGFVGAEPKSWKSWVTLSIGICVASGRDVFRRFAVEQGRVVMLNAEGGKGLARHRAGMLCRAMGIEITSLDLELVDVDILRIDDSRQAGALLATVEARKPTLLILDPLRELHTGDENDSAAIAGLLGPLRTMQARLGTAIMVVHHSVKAPADGNGRKRGGQRLRGSSALHGASDSALYLTVDGEGENKRVKVEAEHRAAAEPEPFTLAMREHAGPDGKALWLEIVDGEGDGDEQEAERTIAKREKDRAAILRAIRLAAMPGRTPLKSKRGVAPAAKVRLATVGPLLDELIAEGAVVVGDGGDYLTAEQSKERGSNA